MTSFYYYLTSPDPEAVPCEVCGANPYTCHCDDTPNVDMGLIVSMYHPMNHKRQTVEYKSTKYRALIACGWVELDAS